MAGFNHFDYVPSTVDRKRSVFKFDKACARSAYIGWLYPVCAPVRMMPGSTLSLDLAAEIRSGALVAPLMDELQVDFYSFFVPNRIVWEHWKQFIGAVDDVLFNNLTQYQIPHFRFGCCEDPSLSGSTENRVHISGSELFSWNQTIACHYGLPYPDVSLNYAQSYKNKPFINALPFRGYTMIWNLNFRPEQLAAPLVISKSDAGYTGQNIEAYLYHTRSWNSTNLCMPVPSPNLYEAFGGTATQDTPCLGGAILPTFRVHRSLWTSCLPAPSLETLNLLANLSAPVITGSNVSQGQSTIPLDWTDISTGNLLSQQRTIATSSTGGTYSSGSANVTGDPLIAPRNLVADLNQALLTVNNYRETIMLQNYYDVLNRAGSRYDEIIRNIFGVQTSNAVTDIPELITHKRFTIYRKEVVATAETVNSSDQVVKPVGSQSSYIDTVVKDSYFTKSTTEHGYIHMLYTIRPARIRMNQGIEPEWEELDKFSLYYPQFDGMGDVKREKREVVYSFTSSSDGQHVPLGYQEYGAVWKWQRSDNTGFCDENITGSIRGLTISDKQSSAPVLVNTDLAYLGYASCFSEAEAFSNCLAITSPLLAPHFILDIRLNGSISHPMPVYNIPGQGALL